MRFYFFILIISFFFSCETSDGVTDSNYEYKFHTDKEGGNPKVGDQVIFREYVYHNDKLIYSSDDYGKKQIILPDTQMLARPIPPNYEVLFKMSPGDSVSVFQKLEGLDKLPENYKTEDVLKYIVTLLEITPKDSLPAIKKKGRTASDYPFERYYQSGNILAQPGDRVRFHEYRYINDSLIFSTPIEKPMQAFLPARKDVPTPPPGNYEALLLCGIDDSLRLDQLLENVKNLPAHLSKNDTIKYEIKVIDILTPGEYAILKKGKAAKVEVEKKDAMARSGAINKMTRDNITAFKNGELDDQLEYTRSGLKYLIHEMGEGKMPNPTEEVEVRFAGFLMDGTSFDSSFEKGETLNFQLGMGRMIKGWDEGISKFPVGSKVTFFIPYKLAYGVMGSPPRIPISSDLVYYIAIVSVEAL